MNFIPVEGILSKDVFEIIKNKEFSKNMCIGSICIKKYKLIFFLISSFWVRSFLSFSGAMRSAWFGIEC